jgi:hypothetical protein
MTGFQQFSYITQALALLIAALILTACVTPTPYQAAGPNYGYSEQRLDQNKFRVTFKGNSLTKRETVEDYLLYRAAELTRQNGYSHFLMASRDTVAQVFYRETIHSYGGRGWFWHGWPDWHPQGYPYGWRDPFWYDPWTRPWLRRTYKKVTSFSAYADIEMVRGPERRGEFEAFDAQSVIATVGPRVVRPEQAR